MFIVGLTGGIGSGKTAVSDYIAEQGICIIDADICSRIVVENGRPALQQIADHFGSNILLANGELNRATLRQRIFATPSDKQWLETLLHPLIGEEILNQLNAATSDYAMFVSPLLTETQQHLMCDRILVVDTDENTQLQRTMTRDANNAEQVKRIIASQSPRNTRLNKADDVLSNNGSLQELQAKAQQLHQHYLTLACDKAKEQNGNQP